MTLIKNNDFRKVQSFWKDQSADNGPHSDLKNVDHSMRKPNESEKPYNSPTYPSNYRYKTSLLKQPNISLFSELQQ